MISWDRILAVASLISGLAGLFATYIAGSLAWALAGAFVTIILLAAGYWIRFHSKQAPIHIAFQKFAIEFPESPALARALKEYEFFVRRPDLSMWVHRNISADGSLTDFTWDGRPIPENDMVARCNDLEITTRNPYPWPLAQKQRGTLGYTIRDSFPAAVEYLQYTADIPTTLAVLYVKFPDDKRCTNAYVQRRRGGVNEELNGLLTRDPAGRWAQVEIRKPRGGDEYTLFWHW